MEKNKLPIRQMLLELYQNRVNATKAQQEICAKYGDSAISVRMCQVWYARFKVGNLSLEDFKRSGRPSKLNIVEDNIRALVATNPTLSTREIAQMVSISQGSVCRRLRQLGFGRTGKLRGDRKLELVANEKSLNEQDGEAVEEENVASIDDVSANDVENGKSGITKKI